MAKDDMHVDPWTAKNINYDKLVDQFGCDRIDDALVGRIEKLTGKRAHPLLRRFFFYFFFSFSLSLFPLSDFSQQRILFLTPIHD